ncbi:MAG: molybdopterin-dependent oxidoreductase [Anaerolineae bacterium]
MPETITRRQFLKVSAAAGAATVISGCTTNLQRTEYLETYVRPPEEGLPGEDLWYASTCRQCPAGCGIIVRISNGRARKIEGNPQHPLNQGKLCARGQAGLQVLYNPDRVRNALRQTGGRGSQQFEPLYWDDALRLLTGRLQSVPDPGGIVFLGGLMSDHLYAIASRFLAALGASPPMLYDLHSELEGRQALTQASQQLFGNPALPVFDIGTTDVVFSFGASFLETWLSPVSYGRAYGHLRQGQAGKRGYVVQFEPRFSSTAASADEWVPLRPSTEGLVALALGKIIVEQGLGHEIAHREHAVMYEKVHVGEVAQASEVPAEELERLARVFAGVDHQVVIPGATLAASLNGEAAIAAVHALNVTMRRLGEHGGVFLTGMPPVGDFAPPVLSTFADVQGLIARMRAGQVKLLFIHGVNSLFELPAAVGFEEALAQVPFVVSFSPFVDETAAQANLILPDHTYLEGWGYQVVSPGADRPVISSQQPVVRPLYDTRATADVVLALAQELGGEVARALPWRNEVEFLKETATALRDVGTSAEVFWATWRQRGGWWPQGQEWQSPEPAPAFEAPLVIPEPRFEGSAAAYPFHLHLYPSIALSDGRGANQPWLQETPDPMTTVAWNTWIEINPKTATRLGVENDDIVKVTSPAGEIEAAVYVYPGIRPDVIALPIGQGHSDYGRYAQGRGNNPVDLLVPAVDEETGALAWGATRVRITPTGRRHPLARLESNVGVDHAREAGAPG